MRQRHRVWRSVGVAAAVVCASLASAACGGASGSEEESATTTTPSTTEPPTTTTTLDPQAQALADAEAAYLAYEEAYLVAAADPVSPQFPELQALITGRQRIHLNSELGSYLANGQAVRLPDPPQTRHDVLDSQMDADNSVRLTVCEVDDGIVYRTSNGEIVNDNVATKTVAVTMVNEDTAWKVEYSEVADRQDGVVPCAG